MAHTTDNVAREVERMITALREELARVAAPETERRLRHAIALLSGAIDELVPLRAFVAEIQGGARPLFGASPSIDD